MQTVTRNIVAGLLAIIPLWVTIWVIWFVVDLLVGAGRPVVSTMSRAIRSDAPGMSQLLLAEWFQSALALLVTLLGLYLLGWIANAVIGRRIFRLLNRVMDRLPLARTIYGATQTLIESLRGDPTPRGQRIVLIEFPAPGRRAVGIVTRVFPASEAREELAAVYVPTTPNPTSGFVQIVPSDSLIWLDWTKNDAMAFIVSGGAMTPDNLRLDDDIRVKK